MYVDRSMSDQSIQKIFNFILKTTSLLTAVAGVQGQAMASILIKLMVDMWLDMPAHTSLPLVLSMLQAALLEGDVACRTRVFDLLYNLSLHAHAMVPLEAGDSDSGPASPRSDGRVKDLFYGSSDVPEHVCPTVLLFSRNTS